mmetsp:Transcript_28409/g.94318  ORF Transcript_28409/g.94318 Transcript_28409/m.94318 type:complete len:163 (+) Transcript_28409:837-1325(+)
MVCLVRLHVGTYSGEEVARSTKLHDDAETSLVCLLEDFADSHQAWVWMLSDVHLDLNEVVTVIPIHRRLMNCTPSIGSPVPASANDTVGAPPHYCIIGRDHFSRGIDWFYLRRQHRPTLKAAGIAHVRRELYRLRPCNAHQVQPHGMIVSIGEGTQILLIAY